MQGRFRIGDGEITSLELVSPVYLSYDELDVKMNEEFFKEEIKKYKVFYESKELKNITFTPKKINKQDMSEFYFLRLDVKIPHN